jgi:hypothetical protein
MNIENQLGLRLAICGPSGIGKSIIMNLLAIPGADPRRVRIPRMNDDPKICMQPKKFETLKRGLESRAEGPVYKSGDLAVYSDWAVFRIRGKDWQALPLDGALKDTQSRIRVEIFAPTLLKLLRQQNKLRDILPLQAAETLIILLNPTQTSYRLMNGPTRELREATFRLIYERMLATNTRIVPEQIQDIQRRSGQYLAEELGAWKKLAALGNCVEYLGWRHSEAECILDNLTAESFGIRRSGIRSLRIKRDILHGVAEKAPQYWSRIRDAFKTKEEIF